VSRVVVVLLLVAGVAGAAPVPKAQPKLEEVFGEVADKKDGCKYEMDKRGALTVTVPANADLTESFSPPRPRFWKEVTGDFAATVRVKLTMSDKVGKPPRFLGFPEVMAGLGVESSADGPVGGQVVAMVKYKFREKNQFGGDNTWDGDRDFGGITQGLQGKTDDARYVRLTRRGVDVTYSKSEDGQKWEEWYTRSAGKLPDIVRVGPLAHHTTDSEFSATFDQYEIKPLKKDEKK
jgi:hypothetical protein